MKYKVQPYTNRWAQIEGTIQRVRVLETRTGACKVQSFSTRKISIILIGDILS